jgi:hypothetical protein
MSFKNQLQRNTQPEDDGLKRLLCTVSGCGKRWTVDMGRPMCSKHAWADDTPSTLKDVAALLPNEPKAPQWYDKDAF